MKILVFTGGLGNQIFEYAFYLYLRNQYPQQHIYGLYGKKLSEHYGLEIDKWFSVKLPQQPWWIIWITGAFYFYKQLFPNSKWLDLNQRDWVHLKAKIFFPFKFNKKFIPVGQSWIQWKIDESKLCLLNRDILHKIRTLNSCFIHVRRGDYLSYDYKSLFSGCCTIDYYKRAVELMKKKYYDVRFICFSDDIPWVKENLKIDDAFYVDWNIGKDSPLDMYLMSQCKNGIIANSTFSYWGARLGYKKNTLCYPIKWWNEEKGNPDIFLEGWIGL